MVLDQHDEEVCKPLKIDRELSNGSWRTALSEGRETCYVAYCRYRSIGRNGWHHRQVPQDTRVGGISTLFRWNESWRPFVEVCGDPIKIVLRPDGPKWSL